MAVSEKSLFEGAVRITVEMVAVFFYSFGQVFDGDVVAIVLFAMGHYLIVLSAYDVDLGTE